MDSNLARTNRKTDPLSGKLQVLIVEDNPDDADLMLMNLSREGYSVDWRRVENEPDFLKALETPCDLILSDWNLPQFSGLRALQLIKERGLPTPFILVSGGIGEETAVAVMRQGAADYLKKDRMDRLGQAVKNALEQKLLQEEYQKASAALAASEAELRALFASMRDVVMVLDREGVHCKIAPAQPDLLVRPAEELLGKRLLDVFPAEQAAKFLNTIHKVLDTQQTHLIEYELFLQNRSYWFETSVSPLSDQQVVWVARDISERKQAQAQIQLQAAALASTANAIMIADPGGQIEWVNPAFTTLTGYSLQEAAGRTAQILKSGDQDPQFYQQLWETILAGRVWRGELVNKRKDGSLYYEEQTISPVRDSEGKILKFIGIKQDITQRKQTEARVLTLLQRQTQIAAFGRELVDTRDLTAIFRISQRTLKEMSDFNFFAVVLMDPEHDALKAAYANLDGVELDLDPHLTLKLRDPAAICARAIQERKPVITENATDIRKALAAMRVPLAQDIRSACCLPMLANDQVIGLIELQSLKENAYLSEDLEWMSTIANQIGLNIQNAMYFAEIQQKVDELSTLAVIDSAVISHLEPEKTFALILEQVTTGLKVDAAVLLLFDPKTQMLNCVSEIGYLSPEILQMRLRLGESLAGKAALDRKIVHKDLEDREREPFLKEEFIPKDFLDYYGIPLIADSKLIGVLEILHRSRLTPDGNWLRFLEIMAARAAVAIHTIQLYDNIQDSHEELLEAYELTIEGWSKAMDLRDKETENHTRRVTEMTLRLAETFGIPEEQLVHIRRGALLHDIGKLGVPDQILLKPGQLTAEEWKIMRRHPELAYEMLNPIEYLRPALDIPYCHHEDWDGRGYPRGLKGEEIPLAARIFAAVDVFDALTSDRPYRAAWSVTKTMAYIREQAGKRFDPRVVDVFIEMHSAKEIPHD